MSNLATSPASRINGTVIDLLYYEFVSYLWEKHQPSFYPPSKQQQEEEDNAPPDSTREDTDHLKKEASEEETPSDNVSGSGAATTTKEQEGSRSFGAKDVYDRLQEAGCATGRKLAHLHTARLSEGEKGGPQTMHDVMRFIGRDIWRYLHNKQIDYLSTNSRVRTCGRMVMTYEEGRLLTPDLF
eukprot:gb/GECG01013827.1/.p1 GENE.gb/GECG01013827.1/~~gb/GECG01013827.1/.p1  ORF type:complete len:184 (+),score=30.28 gb/GECG01013827.1/:1-552(+)